MDKATLFVIPGSHPARAAQLMLEAKGVPYRRIDLVPVLSKGIVRAAGFPAATVPAMRLSGKKIQGTNTIAAELDRLNPANPLFPEDPEKRAKVVEVANWADDDLQQLARRMIWGILTRSRSSIKSFLEGAKVGLPVSVAAMTAPPLAFAAKRMNEATDENLQKDFQDLPAVAEKIRELLNSGVIGSEPLNVADYQVATSVRLMMCMDDLRPYFQGKPAGEHAMWICPEYNGYAPAVLPAAWKQLPAGA